MIEESKVSAPETNGAPRREITLRDKIDLSVMVAEAGKVRHQSLKGFDPDYTDIVDYIVRCTHKIWEETGVGLIYSHYSHNVSVWTPNGLIKGREAMVANTLRSLAGYPDRKIYVDEVVWSGNDAEGFHTSMLATVVARNTGWTAYGPPTGRTIMRRGIANCFVRENRIVEEWLAHDEMAVVRQLGFDPFTVAKQLARAEAARGVKPDWRGDIERAIGQLAPAEYPPKTSPGFDVEDFIRRSTHEIWNRRMLNQIRDYYIPNYVCHTTGGRELYGLGDFRAYLLGLLGAFPDAMMTVDHLYWLGNERDGYRTATRWILDGTHDGPGPYGPPTGKRARVLGITQHLIKGGRFVEEWTVFDEIALLKQLASVEA